MTRGSSLDVAASARTSSHEAGGAQRVVGPRTYRFADKVPRNTNPLGLSPVLSPRPSSRFLSRTMPVSWGPICAEVIRGAILMAFCPGNAESPANPDWAVLRDSLPWSPGPSRPNPRELVCVALPPSGETLMADSTGQSHSPRVRQITNSRNSMSDGNIENIGRGKIRDQCRTMVIDVSPACARARADWQRLILSSGCSVLKRAETCAC